MFIASQILQNVAFAIFILSFLYYNNIIKLTFNIVSCCIFSICYYLLICPVAQLSFILLACELLVLLIFLHTNKHKIFPYICTIFMIGFILITVFTFDKWYSILPIIAILFLNVGISINNIKYTVSAIIPFATLLGVFNYFVRLYAGIEICVLMIVFCILYLVKFDEFNNYIQNKNSNRPNKPSKNSNAENLKTD